MNFKVVLQVLHLQVGAPYHHQNWNHPEDYHPTLYFLVLLPQTLLIRHQVAQLLLHLLHHVLHLLRLHIHRLQVCLRDQVRVVLGFNTDLQVELDVLWIFVVVFNAELVVASEEGLKFKSEFGLVINGGHLLVLGVEHWEGDYLPGDVDFHYGIYLLRKVLNKALILLARDTVFELHILCRYKDEQKKCQPRFDHFI